MKKYIALLFALGFFAVLPSAVADDGKLAVDAPAHIRLPHNHNNNHNIILTLRVNNIQVEAGWQVRSDSSLSLQISNGVLSIDEALTVTQIVATVIVQDLFTKLNPAYENLSVQAVISIEIVYDVLLADAPPLRALVGQTGLLHTFAATGEPTAYNIVAGNQTYFSLDNNGVLSLLAGIAVGFYTLTVGVSDDRSNSDQAVATVQIFPVLSLSDAPFLRISIIENAVNVHTFAASGGVGNKTYTVVPVQSSYFSLGVASGVLSAAANTPDGFYTLTVQAADEHNNPIRALATVEILHIVSLPAPSTLHVLEGTAANLHTLVAVGGIGAKSYALVSGNDANHFTLSDGVLAVSGDAVVGEYTLVIEVSDSAPVANKATITVMVEVSQQGQFFVLGGFQPRLLLDAIVSYSTDGVWSSADGNAWVGENDASWRARAGHQAIVHNGIIYVLGGESGTFGGVRQSDVWSSEDGKAWAEETAPAWPSRNYHQAVSHHGKMYVLGGIGSGNTRYSDVWSSEDGGTWIEETANPGWEGRRGHQVVSYNGRMYLLGGRSTTTKNDVWSSTDGKTWSLETNNADWTARYFHRAVVHQGKMYVLGGNDGSNNLHDVWSSADGKTWMEEKANADWTIRNRFAALSFSNTLYVLGGTADDPYYADIWSSADGKAWGQIGALPLTLYDHEAIIFPPPLALFGVGEVLSLTAGVAKSELHRFMSEYGKGEYSYEMSPAEVGFAVSDNGVLSADASIAAGDYTLTVWVSDGVGDRAQTAVKVQVALILFDVGKVLTLTAGIAESELHTFTAYGQGQYTYSLSAEGGFAVSDNGVLSADASTTAGIYTLMVWVFDGVGNRAQTAVKVLVVEGASSFAIHSGIFPIFSPSALVGGVRGRASELAGGVINK